MATCRTTRPFPRTATAGSATPTFFANLFETVVRRCMAEGLVGGEGFAVDASLIVADAHRQRGCRDARATRPQGPTGPSPSIWRSLDDAAFGAATPVEPKFISPTDPAARWTAAWVARPSMPIPTNYLIDLEHAVIVDVEALDGRAASRGHRRQDHDRAHHTTALTLRPERLIADTAYGSAEMLNWLVERPRDRTAHPGLRQIQAHRRHYLARGFRLRSCQLTPTAARLERPLQRYRRQFTDAADWRADGQLAALPRQQARLRRHAHSKPRCCPNAPARKVPRSIHEGARDLAREIAKTEAYLRSRAISARRSRCCSPTSNAS